MILLRPRQDDSTRSNARSSESRALARCNVSGCNGIGYVRADYILIHCMMNLLTCRLYGATLLQLYFYFRHYKQDRMFLKCAVVYLWYDNPTCPS